MTATNDLFVSQSVITGESAVVEKCADTLPQQPYHTYADYRDIAFMGSTIMSGNGEGVVLAVGQDTVYGDLPMRRATSKTDLTREQALSHGC